MCRGKDHGGRRCPADGAVARRNRRQNAKLKVQYEAVIPPVTEPELLDVVTDGKVTIETVRKLASEYRSIRENCYLPVDEKDHFHHAHPLTDAEILAEKKLIELGAAVTELSYEYGAPTPEEWDAFNELSDERYDEYDRTTAAKYDELAEAAGATVISGFLPGKRVVEYADRWGDKHTANESYFYEDAVIEANKRSDYEKAEKIYKIMEDIKEAPAHWESGASDAEYMQLIKRRREAYREALIATGVEFAGTDDLKHTTYDRKAKAVMAKVATLYPKQWIDESNKQGGLKVVAEIGRARYAISTQELRIDNKYSASTATHELAHRLEHTNPEIGVAERAFLNRRSGILAFHKGERKEFPVATGTNGKDKELGYNGEFVIPYMGRAYDYERGRVYDPDKGSDGTKGDSCYEIVSMGMESVFFGKYSGGVGRNDFRKDPEHTNFIVGLLATTAKY